MKKHGEISWQNIHLLLVAVLLAIVGSAKLISAAGGAAVLDVSDPLLGLRNRHVMLLVGSAELAAVGYLLRGRSCQRKHMLVLWLSMNFMLYRLGIWWVSPGKACPCLGMIATFSSFDAEMVDGLLRATVAYMFLGSVYFLARGPVAWAVDRLSERAYRRLKWVLTLGSVLLLLPALQVGCVAVLNPPTTGPILVRGLTGKLSDVAPPPARFVWRRIEAVPPMCLKALLAAEDSRFLEHSGFSWRHIRLALIEAKASGTPPRGASTITQQCARSLFLWQGRSWVRKGLEAYYTIWMEMLLSKRRILELYTNVIELGDGVYGVEAGAQHHYGVSVAHLTAEQAAMLAAVLPRPRHWDPKAPNPDVLRRRNMIMIQASQMRLPLRENQ